MLGLYSRRKIASLLAEWEPKLEEIGRKYPVDVCCVKAVLFTEMLRINMLDVAADFAVHSYWLRGDIRRKLFEAGFLKSDRPLLGGRVFCKKDSSVGLAQIFGFVAIDAINFAIGRGFALAAELGVPEGRRLDKSRDEDLRYIWTRALRDRGFNIELCALNLLAAAQERTGRVDFGSYSPEELKLIFTRYNGTVNGISSYGEEAYARYLDLKRAACADKKGDIK